MSAHEDDHASTAAFVAAFLALILFGLAVRYWVWVAAGAGVLVLGAVLLWLAFYAARRVDKRHEAQAAFVARADQQHAWVLAGDDRGIYGDYRPEVYPSGRG
jgi:EamA domain-containing membrane protein RarD